MSTASQVRNAYRRLLKVERRRFAGDLPVQAAAQKQTRSEFESNRTQTDEKKIQKLLKHAKNVEEVIRRYVVQAPRSETKENTYDIKFTSEHALRDRHPIIVKSSLQKNKSSSESNE
ncbi:Complex III assembly factor lyrm7 [Coemansia erecta]|uniref:Mitochondrial zinc maintenance protein 1, mitochondrial n=1 Tax=Coemansia asiatica TaxID=1052880 RepID=A0A9W7XFX8_9FUNG|nr:Complex III assembly factor lyrm7 [Coemansia asiatica]KAJ2847809.1 Complex III assembly factor lyrm7 [Coemansia erecta]KAJ2870292.1 Complex III assembly factor lyrm7 [Coemansia asiatica]